MRDRFYAQSHKDRINLLIHLVAVPLFWLGTLVLLTGLSAGLAAVAAGGLTGIAVSLALQGFGHKREATLPKPFSGPLDFATRIFREQFYSFPAFVLNGGWLRNLRQS